MPSGAVALRRCAAGCGRAASPRTRKRSCTAAAALAAVRRHSFNTAPSWEHTASVMQRSRAATRRRCAATQRARAPAVRALVARAAADQHAAVQALQDLLLPQAAAHRRRGLPRRHEASGRPDPSGRHGGLTSGVRRLGLRHRLRTRQSLIGTRSFGTGHRREPYSSNTASWADVSGHNTLKIGRGEPRRSKGDNPYPTSSKALAPETRLMCLLEQAAGVLARSSRLRMAPRDNHGWIPGVAAHTCRTALGGFGAAGQYARRGQV